MFKHLGTFAILAVCLFAIVIVMGGCDETRQMIVPPSVEAPGTESPGTEPPVTQQRFTGTLPVPDNANYLQALAWNPQGTLLAAGFHGEDPVWLYDTATGTYLKNIEKRDVDFDEGVTDYNLAWGSALFIGTDTWRIEMWDPATGQHLRTIAEDRGDFVMSPDSRILAVAEWPGLELIDVGTGQVLRTISEEYEWEWFDFDGSSLGKRISHWSYSAVAFSPDGSTIALGASRQEPDLTFQLHLYDVATGRKEVEGVGHIGGPRFRSVAWNSDGSMLACLFHDGSISWVDAVTGQPYGPEEYPNDFPDDVSRIAWHPTTPSILALGRWNGVIELWDLDFATWQHLKTLTHGDDVDHLAFSPDGKTLASGEESPASIRLWDVSDVR